MNILLLLCVVPGMIAFVIMGVVILAVLEQECAFVRKFLEKMKRRILK